MALNDVRLYGQISEEPSLYFHRNEDTPYRGAMLVKTISRYHNSTSRDTIVYDEVVVMTHNPEMLLTFADLKKNDIIYLKGLLCTADILRTYHCDCGNKFSEPGTTCYIHPIHIITVEQQVSDERGYTLLRRNAEVSNEVIVDGMIVTPVDYSPEYSMANYKVAVKRPYRIIEDAVEKKQDFPAVNTYFEQAQQDAKCAHVGTRLNIRGSVRARVIDRKTVCPSCGHVMNVTDRISEIVASYVGYTHDWNRPDTEEESNEVIINTGREGEDS